MLFPQRHETFFFQTSTRIMWVHLYSLTSTSLTPGILSSSSHDLPKYFFRHYCWNDVENESTSYYVQRPFNFLSRHRPICCCSNSDLNWSQKPWSLFMIDPPSDAFSVWVIFAFRIILAFAVSDISHSAELRQTCQRIVSLNTSEVNVRTNTYSSINTCSETLSRTSN